MKRRFIDAYTGERCKWTVTLKDGRQAQCGRRRTTGDLCTQHAKMLADIVLKMSSCCGGTDEYPPEHCQDCEKVRLAQEAK